MVAAAASQTTTRPPATLSAASQMHVGWRVAAGSPWGAPSRWTRLLRWPSAPVPMA